jgi:tRNA G18 (ribose-2'-O)-methylase SpoU
VTRIHEVTSLDDPAIEAFRDVRDRDLKGRDQLFMAESELVLLRLLRQPDQVHAVLISPEKYRRLQDALRVLPETTPIHVASLDLIGEIAGFHVHRGVLATGVRPTREQLRPEVLMASIPRDSACTLLLATGMTNVDNMGSLFRNAAAFGVDGVLLDDTCCDPLYRKAIRVSMGHVLNVPWAITADWAATLAAMRSQWSVQLVGAECDPRATPIQSVALEPRVGFVLGAEGPGLDPATLDACDQIVEIPMAVGVPSLNVSTAAAILLWERWRAH